MHLHLKPHRQCVGNDSFRQCSPRNRCLAGGNRFQRLILLLRRERMHPRKKQGAYQIQPVFGDFLPGPLVIFNGADDELDFVGRFQVFEVFPAIASGLAAAGAFQIHDAPDARVNRRDVMRAAGFEQHGETIIAKPFHQRQGIFLEQRFTAGKFNQWQETVRRGGFQAPLILWTRRTRPSEKRSGQPPDFHANFFE